MALMSQSDAELFDAFCTDLSEHKGLLKSTKESDEQAQRKIAELEKKAGRTGQQEEEIARLKSELEKEHSDLAVHVAAWAAQEPEKFAPQTLPDREIGIWFFLGL
ncbi:unnamed protein product [Cuscuta campestris]|uniref:Uncharacterized protein n=1 Tax=Cuscuta campestris TaxID=132261 RepID=A0A484LET9_9ASTE|nr:unnamed protein product [Cuscuta campestris]